MSINQSLSFRRSSNSKLVTSHKKQNVVRANSQLLKKPPLFYQDSSEALKSVYLAEQQNPIKFKQRSKSKKKLKKQNPTPVYQNSNRRKNDINCEQILNLLKKRETHSALDNHHQIPSSISSSNLSKVKPKMKKKKKTPIYVLPRMQAHYQAPNILKNGQLLSQSSSFIVFSDKQSASLNNTLLRSKVSHYKKAQIKPQKAAILIQKIWRGYMTRKLLQQYIKDQEPKIMEALKSLNSSAKQSITSSIFSSSLQQKNCQKLKQLFNYLNQDGDKLNEDNNQNKQIPEKAQLQDISSIIEDTIKNVGFVDYNHQLLNSFHNSALADSKDLEPQTPQSSHNGKKTNNCISLEQDKVEQAVRTNSAKDLPFPNKSSTLKQLSHPHQLPHKNQCGSKEKQKVSRQNKVKLVLSMPQSLQITVKPESKRSSLNVSEFFYSQQSNLQFIINNKIQNLIQKHKKFINQLLQENQLTLPIYLQRVKMLKSVKQACFQGSKKFCMEIQRVLADLKASSFYDTQEEQEAISQQRQESQSSQNDINSNVREINQSLRKPSSEIFNLQSVQPLKLDKDINSLRFQNKENQQIFSNHHHQINSPPEQNGQASQTTFGNHQIVEMLKSSKPNSVKLQSNSKIEKKSSKVSYHVGIQQIKMYTQNIYNQIQQCKQSVTELQFLCQLLRRHSENGAQNMIERCLIQFLVELITSQYPIESVLKQILSIIKGNNKEKVDAKDIVYSKDRQLRQIILRWAKQLSKWDLGTIQQVSHVMESSSFLTEGNQNQHIS